MKGKVNEDFLFKITLSGKENDPPEGWHHDKCMCWFGDNKSRVWGKSHPNSEILTPGKGVYPVSGYNAEQYVLWAC